MAAALEDNTAPQTFKVAVNRVVMNKDTNYESLAKDFQNYGLTQQQLADEINQGHAFTTHHEGRRNQDNFIGAGYIALDFDKTDPQQMREILEDPMVKKYYGIFYHTPSSTPTNPKFRLVFQLEKSVSTADFYRKLVAAFIWKFAATVDPSCKDPCRFFYGSKGSNPQVTNRIIPIAEVEKIVEAYEQDQKYDENLRNQARKVSGNFTGEDLTLDSKRNIFDRILESHCIRVRNAGQGDRHNTLIRTARALGGYIAGEPEATDEFIVRERLRNAYLSHDRVDHREMEKAIDAGLRYGEKAPLHIESLIQPASPATGGTNESATTEQPEAKRLFWKLSNLKEYPKPVWLIEGTIKKNSLAYLIGPPKCGKSFYALLLALVCASNGHKVLYIAAEDPGDYYQRSKAWCDYYGVDQQLIDDNIVFYPEPIALHDDTKRRDFLTELKKEFNPDLIVVDTLAMNSLGLDENSQKDMGIFVNALSMMRLETSACILTVHHTNRAGLYRGSSVLPGSADTFILANQEGDKIWKGGQLKIVFDMQKNSKPVEDKFYKAEYVNDTLVLVDTKATLSTYAPVVLTEMDKEILKVLIAPEATNGLSVPSIVRYAGWPKEDESKRTGAYKLCKDMAEAKYLNCLITQTKNTTRILYSITPKGRDVVQVSNFGF